jgi:hypothetical protein
MKKNDGGSAFPSEKHECQDNTWNQTFQPGMTYRQWLAGMALQGELANPRNKLDEAGQFAQWALDVADALIAAEEQEKE